MNERQILKAADRYVAVLKAKLYEPKRHPADQPMTTRRAALDHALWMALELRTFTHKLAKAERWLCFIQGILWTQDGFTIEEFKDDNRGED